MFQCYTCSMKTLIWDFNGTILDDMDLCLDIENRMLKERGLRGPVTAEDYREHFRFPVIEYYYWLGYTFETETYEDISVEWNRYYEEGFAKTRLMDGYREKIAEAKEKGYQNVILSASRQDALRKQCQLLGIENDFLEILGMDNYLAHSKIEMAKHWMIRSGVSPDDCVYIGDTLHDMETAEALNIENYILIACGHQSYEVLKEKTDRVVHTLSEVEI